MPTDDDNQLKPLAIRARTKARLDARKQARRESYDQVIERLLDEVEGK